VDNKNYYLFVAHRTHPGGFFKAGDCGVGRTKIGPGVRDCSYGIFYVVSFEVMPIGRPGAESIKKYILLHYLGKKRSIKQPCAWSQALE